MIHATCPAGDTIPAHAHADTHETFYVIDGKVRVFVEAHAYRVEAPARMLGVLSGGFERFFQQMGTPADTDFT
jgi:quercetin 2,3-dioxygenase